MCPDNTTDFPQEYLQPPLNIAFYDEFDTQDNVENFDMNQFYVRGTTHVLFGGTHYFFGGEDARLDNKVYNNYVYTLGDNKLDKTQIELPGRFSRAVSAVYKNQVWLCGSGHDPNNCYVFGGRTVSAVKNSRTLIGHTDGAGMVATQKMGLTIIGGRSEIAYPDMDSISGSHSANNDLIEHLNHENKWLQRRKLSPEGATDEAGHFPAKISHMTLLNIHDEIWSLGGFDGDNYITDVWRLALAPNCKSIFEAGCSPQWYRLNSMQIGRSGFHASFYDNEIMMIGAAMASFGIPHEKWTIPDSWTNNNDLKSKIIADVSQMTVSIFYDTVVIPECNIISAKYRKERSPKRSIRKAADTSDKYTMTFTTTVNSIEPGELIAEEFEQNFEDSQQILSNNDRDEGRTEELFGDGDVIIEVENDNITFVPEINYEPEKEPPTTTTSTTTTTPTTTITTTATTTTTTITTNKPITTGPTVEPTEEPTEGPTEGPTTTLPDDALTMSEIFIIVTFSLFAFVVTIVYIAIICHRGFTIMRMFIYVVLISMLSLTGAISFFTYRGHVGTGEGISLAAGLSLIGACIAMAGGISGLLLYVDNR